MFLSMRIALVWLVAYPLINCKPCAIPAKIFSATRKFGTPGTGILVDFIIFRSDGTPGDFFQAGNVFTNTMGNLRGADAIPAFLPKELFYYSIF